MSKHTSGEWTFDASDDGTLIYVSDDRYRFSARLDMTPGNCGPNRVGKKKELRAELAANARLIAAAPDLLAAVQFLLTASGEQLTTAFEQAQEAVTKAIAE